MNTSAVFIEHLIIGIQALCWIAVGMLSLFGNGWYSPDVLTTYKDYNVIISVILLCAAYPLGIALDTFADEIIFQKWADRIAARDGVQPKLFEALLDRRAQGGQFLFNYGRARLRLLRSSAVNAFLLLCAGLLLRIRHHEVVPAQWADGVYRALFFLPLLAAAVFAYAWMLVHRNQVSKARRLHDELGRISTQTGPGTAPAAHSESQSPRQTTPASAPPPDSTG
ncbi:MAG: hypothetical protein FJW39_10230 [Acidobacteria bacterium]|nr:hypothetical protein [Acidobacteriota bacterium]